jgi:hypothetical protein
MGLHVKPTILTRDGWYAPAIELQSGFVVRQDFTFTSQADALAAAEEWFAKETAGDAPAAPVEPPVGV